MVDQREYFDYLKEHDRQKRQYSRPVGRFTHFSDETRAARENRDPAKSYSEFSRRTGRGKNMRRNKGRRK